MHFLVKRPSSHKEASAPLPRALESELLQQKDLWQPVCFSLSSLGYSHWLLFQRHPRQVTVLPEQGDFTTISQTVFCRILISDRYQEKGARHMSEAPPPQGQTDSSTKGPLSAFRMLMCAEECFPDSFDHRVSVPGLMFHQHNPRLSGVWRNG